MSRQVNREEINTIAQMMEAAQIPLHVWLPIMHLESSGNIQAHNQRGEDSRGLFQINLAAGGGRWVPDFVRELNLFDPIENAAAILTHDWLGNQRRLKTMMTKTNPADQAAYMYQHGIRPRFTPALEQRIRYYSTEGLDELKERYGLTGAADEREFYGPFQPETQAAEEHIPWWHGIRWTDEAVRQHRQQYAAEHDLEMIDSEEEGMAIWWRVILVILGVIVGIVALILLFLKPEGKILSMANAAVKAKTAGLIGKE